MIKKLWAASGLLLAIVLAYPFMAYADSSSDFQDVSGTHWAKEEINSMARLGIVAGYSDKTFKPNKEVTREEFATLITRAFYLELPSEDQKPSFVDVSSSRWSFVAIEAAKEYLTGYYPPSGKAFFDPTGSATREDVAVALVKTLGYQPDDLENENILMWYDDTASVSPNMKTYFALAVEKKLITGYGENSLAPDKPVTRAEATTLLYRAIKGAAADADQSLILNVEAPETVSTPTFYITGDVTKGAQVFINNEQAEVVQGQFRVGFRLKEEGTYTYTVSARIPGGKTQSVTKKVTFAKGAPALEVSGIPEITDKQEIEVRWKVKDENDPNPKVSVNGELQHYSATSARISLKDGSNEVIVVAENSYGQWAKVVKTVVFQGGGPVLEVHNVPQTTNRDTLKISWTVSDKNDYSPKVFVNGEAAGGSTSMTLSLRPGPNTITVKAMNKHGKITEKTFEVRMENSGPVLTVAPIPETTGKESLTLNWTVTDPNYNRVQVYVNNQLISGNSTSIKLTPGPNSIHIKAVNSNSESSEQSFNVTFDPAAPQFTLGYAPESTTSQTITLTWTVSDENDRSPIVYVNDQLISSSMTNVKLTPGVNTFNIVVSNKYGKLTKTTYTVTYTPPVSE
ncbi:hypothetical protein B1A99_13885 [Cohnella sp. CIP 111063]|uniref:S-layer homology domain-containing protein n=1 Tax=unclassified Cohnella TaxID=2636738 RepID=UPI000B8C3A2C|nr:MULTISPECIES: S-layer homology domain-containing protein [unclassified Cohnella]OXS58299.1 hypothetical protein B1A99_13885 [Cohnella sp. CIP 111063]PRX71578.1 S-layer family protein [Cohnella sp. SGD-V74]